MLSLLGRTVQCRTCLLIYAGLLARSMLCCVVFLDETMKNVSCNLCWAAWEDCANVGLQRIVHSTVHMLPMSMLGCELCLLIREYIGLCI